MNKIGWVMKNLLLGTVSPPGPLNGLEGLMAYTFN